MLRVSFYAIAISIMGSSTPPDPHIEFAKSNAPTRVVADGQFIYRLQNPSQPEGLVTLLRSSRSDPPRVQIYPVPGLLSVAFIDNPMPIDVVQGKLQYVALKPAGMNQFDASLGLVHPDELARYPERFPGCDLRKIGPQEAIKGIGLVGIQAQEVLIHGGQLWFDIVEETPRQYLEFIQFANSEGDMLWIRRSNLLSDNLAERWSKQLGDEEGGLPARLVGPFHLFRFQDATYILEANGNVSLFDDKEVAFRKIGELRDLRQMNLSSKNVIFHDRADDNALYVLRRTDDGHLVPLTFTARTSEQASPIRQEIAPDLERAIAASLHDVTSDMKLQGTSTGKPQE